MTAGDDTRTFSDADVERLATRPVTKPPGFDVPVEFWNHARPVVRRRKAAVSLRIDADVLDWFRAQGDGYQSRMNAVLRSYMEATTSGPRRRTD